MNNATKTALIAFVMLVLGFGIGFLVNTETNVVAIDSPRGAETKAGSTEDSDAQKSSGNIAHKADTWH